ncbi:hypothetical protein ARMGADRAFT_1128140 [Armillaria gallica]|uniref:HAT C-terminal dimerisation domain-containing protein n=1 Tax=Armillaria gallica TaxID=47427 RepID=A0A2H3D5I3_ARMGA|nr:hypothetical protein ARMGADRAFT_1128140 [Armillaria gallica]
MDVLPIQGTSVPCEHVFSSSKETDTACRNHLTPEMMEVLQILKFVIHSEGGLNFMQSLSQEAEFEKLECLTRDSIAVPNDLAAFKQSLNATEMVVVHD